MAFGGVETGSMKPIDAPRHAPSAGGRGSTPAAFDTAMATGTTIVAAAVFDVVSERTIATAVNNATRPNRLSAFNAPASPSPIQRARPVPNIKSPNANPPPNSRMVPQSMRTASRQPNVNSILRALTGNTNRSSAPASAAMDSGR